uniref:Uncharacterized protein n=1 Tax=viral metagenome TaxID=1070528 RepID=A0A6C0L947_9ZZZZ
MAARAPRYYRPYYPSDSEESDASEESVSDGEQEQDLPDLPDLPDYKAFAEQLFRAAGPPLPTPEKELDFSYNTLDRRTSYGPMTEGEAGYTVTSTTQQVDNVIVLQSLDRDKSIYPQPTNCQLMLPRTYQHVTKFEIADISFIASFFYFRADKYNVSVQFNETGRILYSNTLSPPSSTTPLNLTVKIREGTYTIDTLLEELTTQFNTPPIFYDFIGGYSDFYNAFVNAGDYSINFNYPGDFYYDALRQIYIANPTTAQIVSYYFQQQYALPTSKSVNNNFTDSQVKVAYYYPVLKEFLLDVQSNPSDIMYKGSAITNELVASLIYTFSGLDDPLVSVIVQENSQILDAYRLAHTFRYYPINKYICTYANQNTKVSIQASTLNTSLSTLLTTTYNKFLATQIQRTGISETQFLASSAQITAYKSIISQMYNVLQTNLAKQFGVNFGTYAAQYFLSFSNVMLLKNGQYATNVDYSYTTAASPFLTSNIQSAFHQSNTVYWQSMYNMTMSNIVIDSNSSPNVYNPRIMTLDVQNPFVDSNGNIYVNPVEASTDVIVTVQPGKYTIFPIQSKIRQTAQIETLPRPSIYLYPEWNAARQDEIGNNKFVFTSGYSYALPDQSNSLANIINPLTPPLASIGTVIRTDSIADAYAKQTPSILSLLTTPQGNYFSFQTPGRQPEEGSNAVIYKYQMGLAIFPGTSSIPSFLVGSNQGITDQSTNTFADSMIIFVYHDIAAFYADAGTVGQSKGESPFFYKYKLTIAAGSKAQYIPFTAYEAQTYYVICRPVNKTQFAPITFTLTPFCTSSTPAVLSTNDTSFDPRIPTFNPYALVATNYIIAKVHDPDYIRLPIIDSNGYYYKTTIPSPLGVPGYLPSSSTSPATAPINNPLIKQVFPMGYSTISDDLTDYIPIANTYPPRAFDPTNKFMFRYTPNVDSYDPITLSYDIGPSNAEAATAASLSNVLLYPNGVPYSIPSSNTVREKKIVQYTGTHYIFTESNAFTAKSSNLKPLNSTTFPGLRTPFNARGVSGFVFMPEEGTWTVSRIRFLAQSSNTKVHFLAIYPTAYINSINILNISLTQALGICVLKDSTTYYDTPSVTGVPYGTYYTYSNVLNPNTAYAMSGRSQISPTLITDISAYYSALAYTNPSVLNKTSYTISDFNNSTFVDIENLTGTCIPYPELGTPRIASVFYDGTANPDTKNDMLLSINTPLSNQNPNINPLYLNYYTSQYAQSSPIVNSHLHYTTQSYTTQDFNIYTDFLLPWSNIPDIPTSICASVYGTLLLQTGELPIVTYNTKTQATQFTLKTVLTIDTIFPANEDTTLLTYSGNESQYIFLGCTPSCNLIFKAFDLATGNLIVYPPIAGVFNPQTQVAQGLQLMGTKWWLCFLDAASGMNIAYGSNFTDPFVQMPNSFAGPFTAAQIHLDPINGTNLFFAVSTSDDTTISIVYSYPLILTIPPTNSLTVEDYNFCTLPSDTNSFAVQVANGIEFLYYTSLTSTYLNRIDTSSFVITRSEQNYGRVPSQCIPGPYNTMWVLFNTPPYIMAYIYTVPSIQIAWQQMFPVLKVELVQVAEKRISIPDTYNKTTPEWYHSVFFSYKDSSMLSRDLYYTYPTTTQWGQEVYYDSADTSFGGYYFNSYLQSIPLQSNTSYIALRGFSPTESFQTEVRISLTNVFDYGYISINNLIDEIGTIATSPGSYAGSYLNQLSTFNGAFVRTGNDALYGISSFSVPTAGFSNFITQFSTIYSEYTFLTSNVSIINTSLTQSMNAFILSDLQYILPPNVLTRTRFTDSLTFSFLWKTGLASVPPSYANLADGWGLGWNLGYAKEDDVQATTVHPAPSMYKIIDDFLYLRLNPEFNLNRMSAGTKENYLDSREPSALTSYYYCKLLLNGYGQTATTFVHSPIILNPPISRISKLSFQWLDSKGNVLNVSSATDSDWQMTINIQENTTTTKFVATAPGSNLPMAVKE